MLERLLSYLYAALANDPQQVLALRLRHPAGLHWQVANRTLTLRTEAGAPIAAIDLVGRTVDQVADLAVAAGCSIEFEDAEQGGRAAEVLLNGEGRESESNGDHLWAYTALLYSLIDAFASALEVAERDGIVEGLKQAYLHTAAGEWLDLWGSYFGVGREAGEPDPAYLVRMVEEVLRPRNNAVAIEQTIKKLTGADVYLREPWREIFTLDVSQLSGGHKFQDGSFYTWTVFEPIILSFVSVAVYERIVAIINRNRPAGVLPVGMRMQPPAGFATWPGFAGLAASIDLRVATGLADRRANVLSSSLVLSDEFFERAVNFELRHFGVRVIQGTVGTAHRYDAGRNWLPRFVWDGNPWGTGVMPSQITQAP